MKARLLARRSSACSFIAARISLERLSFVLLAPSDVFLVGESHILRCSPSDENFRSTEVRITQCDNVDFSILGSLKLKRYKNCLVKGCQTIFYYLLLLNKYKKKNIYIKIVST